MFEKFFNSVINAIIGETTPHRITEDLKARFLRNNDYASVRINTELSRSNIRAYYKKALEDQTKTEELAFIIGGLATVMGVLISILAMLNIVLEPIWSMILGLIFGLLALYALILSVDVILRKILIKKFAYKIPTNRTTIEELIFMEAWNKGVVNKIRTLTLLPILASIMRFHPKIYRFGLIILEQEGYFSHKKSKKQ